jgi:hypothetical protein
MLEFVQSIALEHRGLFAGGAGFGQLAVDQRRCTDVNSTVLLIEGI